VCEDLKGIVGSLRHLVTSLEPDLLAGNRATELMELFAESERLSAAGRTATAGRAAQAAEWRGAGYRTPAAWVASMTQVSVGQAITTLQTAHHLMQLPATRDAFATGLLSEVQAAEIASAAAATPDAEAALLELADTDTVSKLRDECRQLRATAMSDEGSAERLRRQRYLRHWTDRDGAVRLDGRFAPDDAAPLLAAVDAGAVELQREAKRAGLRESAEACAADALVALAQGSATKAVVHVDVDATAFERGSARPGERCRIRGIGPIPVAVARRFAAEGSVKVIERGGADVRRVAHLGRTIPAHVRTALEARDETCVVPGCEARTGLEIDHIVPLAAGGPTSLDNLARLCRFHHAQKTHRGWSLGGAPGAWTWTRGSRAPPGR
jgi:hypothetical protein